MDPPLILLLTDDGVAGRAMQILLSDWGYALRIGSTAEAFQAGDATMVNGVIADFHHRTMHDSIESTSTLAACIGRAVPILICLNYEPGLHGKLHLHQQVTVFVKPAAPSLILSWLNAQVPSSR